MAYPQICAFFEVYKDRSRFGGVYFCIRKVQFLRLNSSKIFTQLYVDHFIVLHEGLVNSATSYCTASIVATDVI